MLDTQRYAWCCAAVLMYTTAFSSNNNNTYTFNQRTRTSHNNQAKREQVRYPASTTKKKKDENNVEESKSVSGVLNCEFCLDERYGITLTPPPTHNLSPSPPIPLEYILLSRRSPSIFKQVVNAGFVYSWHGQQLYLKMYTDAAVGPTHRNSRLKYFLLNFLAKHLPMYIFDGGVGRRPPFVIRATHLNSWYAELGWKKIILYDT